MRQTWHEWQKARIAALKTGTAQPIAHPFALKDTKTRIRYLRDVDLVDALLKVPAFLYHRPRYTVPVLARRCSLTSPSVQAALAQLEAAGKVRSELSARGEVVWELVFEREPPPLYRQTYERALCRERGDRPSRARLDAKKWTQTKTVGAYPPSQALVELGASEIEAAQLAPVIPDPDDRPPAPVIVYEPRRDRRRTNTLERVREWVTEHGITTVEDTAKALGLGAQTARNALKRLVAEGVMLTGSEFRGPRGRPVTLFVPIRSLLDKRSTLE